MHEVASPPDLRPRQACPRQVTGILHATAVSDRHLSVELHPNGDGRPLTVAFHPHQRDEISAAVCRQVTLVGIVRQADGVAYLELHRIVAVTPSSGRPSS